MPDKTLPFAAPKATGNRPTSRYVPVPTRPRLAASASAAEDLGQQKARRVSESFGAHNPVTPSAPTFVIDPSVLLSSTVSIGNWVGRELVRVARTEPFGTPSPFEVDWANVAEPSLNRWVASVFLEWKSSTRERAISPEDRDYLHANFTSLDWPDVESVISDASYLLPLLRETRDHVSEVFGEAQEVALATFRENTESNAQLTASIPTKLSPADALDRLGALDRTWWVQAVPRSRGRLVITPDFM